MTRISSAFLLGYLVYCLIVFIVLKCIKFDLVYGLVAFLRRRQCSTTCINVSVVVYLLVIVLTPIAIAGAWAMSLKAGQGTDVVRSAGVILTILFSSSILLAFSSWYGSKWYLGRIVSTLLAFAVLAGWVFVLVTTLVPANFSFSGTSAILFSANFLPACYIVHEKTTHKDIPLAKLFTAIATKMAAPKANELEDHSPDETRLQKQEKEQKELDVIVGGLMEGENRYYWWRIAVSVVFYVIPLLAYGIVISANEEASLKGLGLQTPLFLIFSDLVIFTLREQSISFRSEGGSAFFVYDTLFQSAVLLLIRCLLCFQKDYWLIMYAVVYFLI